MNRTVRRIEMSTDDSEGSYREDGKEEGLVLTDLLVL